MGNKRKVILYGAGQLSRIVLYDMLRYGVFEPVAFTVDREYLIQDSIMGLPVVPFEEISVLYPSSAYDMIVICSFRHMRNRKKMYDAAKQAGYTLVNYLSPGAYLDNDIPMGDNNIILSGARLGFDGTMGSNNIIRQNVYLGHEFRIGDHNIISAGCTIGGCAEIGSLCFFGLSVTMSHRRKIGNEVLIGMGSVVTKDIEDYATAYGNPAKVASYHQQDGIVIFRSEENG